MSELGLDLAIAGLVLVTLATRSCFLVIGHRVKLPLSVQQGLRYAPVCALVALVVPQLVLGGPAMHLTVANPRVGAALVAGALMLWRRDMLTAMSGGMAVFIALRLIA